MNVIMKFGGTSVADAEAMTRVLGIVRGRLAASPKDKPPVVVVSAMSKVTDRLIETGRVAALGESDQAATLLGELLDRHIAVAGGLVAGGALAGLTDALRADFADAHRYGSHVGRCARSVAAVARRACGDGRAREQPDCGHRVRRQRHPRGVGRRPARARNRRRVHFRASGYGRDLRAHKRARGAQARRWSGRGASAASSARPPAASPRHSAVAARTTRPPSSARASMWMKSRSGPTSTAC